jgi:8-oxo-dGTP pyrophosphatase MutT (NUDIX family)
MNLSEQSIRQRLLQPSDWPPGRPAPPGLFDGPPKPAAVLAPLLQKEDGWHLLFIRRAASERDRHSGQVAFPGGRVELDDPSIEHAALREAHEEVGLHPDDVTLLGQLGSYHTITHYTVTPVVGLMPWPYSFTLQTDEVARVFTIPLEWLRDPKNYELRQRKPNPRIPMPEPKPDIPVVYFREYDGEVLWGATARMTLNLLDTLDEQLHPREWSTRLSPAPA